MTDQPNTAAEEMALRISTLRSQAAMDREDAATALQAHERHIASAERRERLAGEYEAILSKDGA